MPWVEMPLTPWHMPFGRDGKTYDPGLVVQVDEFRDAEDLAGSEIWEAAPLTRAGRRSVPGYLRAGWYVRDCGGTRASGLMLHLRPHDLYAHAICAAPERVVLSIRGRFLILMRGEPGRVVAIQSGTARWAWHTMADLLLGTLPLGRVRAPGFPEGDLDALAPLVR